eukprot:3879356-Prymnesium_polylepis.1
MAARGGGREQRGRGAHGGEMMRPRADVRSAWRRGAFYWGWRKHTTRWTLRELSAEDAQRTGTSARCADVAAVGGARWLTYQSVGKRRAYDGAV